MTSLSELNTRARALADQRRLGRLDATTVRTEVETLRTDALKLGVGPAFDSEVRRLFADVYAHQPLPPAKLTQAGTAQNLSAGGSVGSKLGFFSLHGAAALEKSVAARVPQLTSGRDLPLPLDTQFPVRTADQKKLALQALERELSGVTVHDPQQKGGRGDLLTKLKNAPGLSPTQRARILENLAEVRVALDGAGTELQRLLGDKPGGVAYQDVNWKHTRLEVDRVLDVAIAKGLYDQGRLRTNLAIDRVMRELERWVSAQPTNSVPRTKDGKIPYLTGALDYSDGPQVAFAKRLRDEGVRLLRMQEMIG